MIDTAYLNSNRQVSCLNFLRLQDSSASLAPGFCIVGHPSHRSRMVHKNLMVKIRDNEDDDREIPETPARSTRFTRNAHPIYTITPAHATRATNKKGNGLFLLHQRSERRTFSRHRHRAIAQPCKTARGNLRQSCKGEGQTQLFGR